jgi:hypothetical protein
MTRITVALALFCALVVSPTEARQRHHRDTFLKDPNCFIFCDGSLVSSRGLRVVKAMGGLGEPARRYPAQTVSHPAGCPARAFCGCGAAVRVFGRPVKSLYLAANWYKFPRTSPAPGAVAVRKHHVFVLEQHLGGSIWLAYDANSGRHATRIHARSISGYVIVQPRV